MSLKDRYHIDTNVWKDMIRNGVISCSVARQDEILSCVKKYKDSGVSHGQAIQRTADDMGVSFQWVYDVLRRWEH